jgi:hypothetical protein
LCPSWLVLVLVLGSVIGVDTLACLVFEVLSLFVLGWLWLSLDLFVGMLWVTSMNYWGK